VQLAYTNIEMFAIMSWNVLSFRKHSCSGERGGICTCMGSSNMLQQSNRCFVAVAEPHRERRISLWQGQLGTVRDSGREYWRMENQKTSGPCYAGRGQFKLSA
jgi:hypothetical protein